MKMDLQEIKDLESEIGYTFKNKNLLIKALTHSSLVYEKKKSPFESNQRLEFLGDAALQISVSEYLFHYYPNMPEGDLTKLRAKIVCEPNLKSTAQKLNFGKYILLGKGEAETDGRRKASLLADCVESVIGAIYLDSGINRVKRFVLAHIELSPENLKYNTDYKTALQEYVQRDSNYTVTYKKESESGPPHEKIFKVSVWHLQNKLGIGEGRSLKKAEQASAEDALTKLGWKN